MSSHKSVRSIVHTIFQFLLIPIKDYIAYIMNTFHTLSQQVDNTLKKEFNRFNEDIIFTTLVPSPSFRKNYCHFKQTYTMSVNG